jgi:hypothetical protein
MSHPAQPPYGDPAAPALPPRRRRPSGWWFVLGGGLVIAAVAAGIGLFVWTLAGFLETDATVQADGQPHRVSVGTAGDRMLWFDESTAQPHECRVIDTASGEELPLEPVTGDYRRSNGTMGDWIGVRRFDPRSGELEVTCTGTYNQATVEIGKAPQIASFVGGMLAAILVPLVLGGAGLLVLIVTGVLFATGAPRKAPDNLHL